MNIPSPPWKFFLGIFAGFRALKKCESDQNLSGPSPKCEMSHFFIETFPYIIYFIIFLLHTIEMSKKITWGTTGERCRLSQGCYETSYHTLKINITPLRSDLKISQGIFIQSPLFSPSNFPPPSALLRPVSPTSPKAPTKKFKIFTYYLKTNTFLHSPAPLLRGRWWWWGGGGPRPERRNKKSPSFTNKGRCPRLQHANGRHPSRGQPEGWRARPPALPTPPGCQRLSQEEGRDWHYGRVPSSGVAASSLAGIPRSPSHCRGRVREPQVELFGPLMAPNNWIECEERLIMQLFPNLKNIRCI